MNGRIAVVTGAASAIGLGVARRFAADGHAVGLFDRQGALQPRPPPNSARGCTAIASELDVADRDAVNAPSPRSARSSGP